MNMDVRPASLETPATEADLIACVLAARASNNTLEIIGGGSRIDLGRPVQAKTKLSLKALTGITLYEPSEMVLSARAGTSLAEIEKLLSEHRQMLPFEPADYRKLLGSQGEPSIGGLVAGNISGPRRIQVGAARDHCIGVRFVNGRGELIKSGGRVMKNVTGLDLVKLQCGAHGTLGVVSEVTFKLLPRPQATGTLVLEDLSDAAAIAALSSALGTPFEVSAAAHLPAGIAGPSALTLLRLENLPVSVEYRLNALSKHLEVFGKARRLDEGEGLALWQRIRDVEFFSEPKERAVWRVSLAPSQAAGFVKALRAQMDVACFYDWGGGLVWLSTPSDAECGAGLLRATLSQFGSGHATLVRASAEQRAHVPVFEPLSAPLMKITQGLKASLDPQGLFNPERMYAGI